MERKTPTCRFCGGEGDIVSGAHVRCKSAAYRAQKKAQKVQPMCCDCGAAESVGKSPRCPACRRVQQLKIWAAKCARRRAGEPMRKDVHLCRFCGFAGNVVKGAHEKCRAAHDMEVAKKAGRYGNKKATTCRYCGEGGLIRKGAHRACYNAVLRAADTEKKAAGRAEKAKREPAPCVRCLSTPRDARSQWCAACKVKRQREWSREYAARKAAEKKQRGWYMPKPARHPNIKRPPAYKDYEPDVKPTPVVIPEGFQITRVPSLMPDRLRDFFGSGRSAVD